MYHRIANEPFDPWGLAVSPERFTRQIEWLRKARILLPLEEFARRLREGSLPRKAVAITFDDAYAETLRTIAPLLAKNGVPATVFVPVGLTRDPRPFWWDALGRIVLDCRTREIRVDGERIPVPEASDADQIWPGDAPSTPRQRLYLDLWSRLRTREPEEIDEIIGAGQAHCPVSPTREDYVPMSSTELREIASQNISLGSHAISHRPLTRLNPADRRHEITHSAQLCAELTGRTPRTFAYPFGDFDDETAAMVQDAGFLCACTTEAGFAVKGTSAFRIPRIQVGDWEAPRLARVLSGR